MHFCKNCKNMSYIRISSEKDDEGNVKELGSKLIYYCKNCGTEDDSITKDNVCVSTTHIKKQDTSFHHMINKYTKMDPTLPHVKNIKCPNSSCPTNRVIEGDEEEIKSDVIYIRYDNVNLKFVYLCSICDHVWKIDNE